VYESASGNDNDVLHVRVLDLLRRGRAGLVTDIDGTIAPIVARPEEAMVLPNARRALEGLRRRLELVAVVTGRSVTDARTLVDVDGITYIGNHGLELFADGVATIVAEAQPWIPRLAAVLDQLSERLDPALKTGVLAENKGATASLHYRLSPDPDRTRQAVLEILASCAGTSGIRIEEGRRVINLLPPLMVSKGSAVTSLVKERALDAIVFLGDDITDAHAFRALDILRQSGRVRTLGIGVVGPETAPIVKQLADATVPSVSAVADLLCAVLAGLEASDRMEPRVPGVGSN
jgi:trehalose 6-phosphate phosphatase